MRDFLRIRLLDPQSFSGIRMIYLNPLTYLFFRRRLNLISNISVVRFDGILMSVLMRLFYKYPFGRNSFDFTSLADSAFAEWSLNKKKIAIYGATDQDLQLFTERIKVKYDINIVDTCNGYRSNNYYVERSKEVNADVVLLGLGIRRQEIVCNDIVADTVVTCGAFITQTANSHSLTYYPRWAKRSGFLWLYRVLMEKGHYKRLLPYPVFVMLFI